MNTMQSQIEFHHKLDSFTEHIKYLKEWHPKKFAALDYIFFMCLRNETNYVSQTTIARAANCVRESANRFVKYLVEAGFIEKQYRHYQTCIYKIPDFFRDKRVLHALKFLLRSINFGMSILQVGVTGVKFLLNYLTSNLVNIRGLKKILSRRGVLDEKVAYVLKNVRENFGIGDVMNANCLFSEAVASLKELGFSLEERIILSQFEDKAILAVRKLYLRSSDVKEKMAWFFAMCLRQGGIRNRQGALSLRAALLEGNEQPEMDKALPLIKRETPIKGNMEVKPRGRFILEARDEDWERDCSADYERIEIENAKKVDVPEWLLLNPYRARVSSSWREEVAGRILAFKQMSPRE